MLRTKQGQEIRVPAYVVYQRYGEHRVQATEMMELTQARNVRAQLARDTFVQWAHVQIVGRRKSY